MIGVGKGSEIAPCSARPGPSAAVIEELYRKASLLSHGLSGIYTRALEDVDSIDADEDLFPFWELSTELLVGLRDLHKAGR